MRLSRSLRAGCLCRCSQPRRQAHQSALYALDFISLLLTKDAPVGAIEISPLLTELVGPKTLGADKVAASKVTEAQKLDDKQIAKGWKAQSLTKAIESIQASAERLEQEIERETKYWEQVLAVSNNGWAVCRLPNEKHILGVRYGFSEGMNYCLDYRLSLIIFSFSCIQESKSSSSPAKSRWWHIPRPRLNRKRPKNITSPYTSRWKRYRHNSRAKCCSSRCTNREPDSASP